MKNILMGQLFCLEAWNDKSVYNILLKILVLLLSIIKARYAKLQTWTCKLKTNYLNLSNWINWKGKSEILKVCLQSVPFIPMTK